MNRVLVFHRNCLFRDCLVNYLKAARDDDATALDHGLLPEVEELVFEGVDVVLLDLNLPCNLALQISRTLQSSHRHIKVILLVADDYQSLFECIATGVHGCVLERSSLAELNLAIDGVLRGETFCSAEFAKTMFSELAKFSRPSVWQVPSSLSTARLTVREQQVLELIAERKCNKEIAKQLSVSLYTVKNHVHNILEKLQVENRLEAVLAAQQEKLLYR